MGNKSRKRKYLDTCVTYGEVSLRNWFVRSDTFYLAQDTFQIQFKTI